MVTYRFNLLFQAKEEDYNKIRSQALRLAQRASAVDSGKFRRGWTARLSGDFLIVSNSVRYAAYVELGSIVHRKHRHKVLRALRGLGIGSPSTFIGGRASSTPTNLSPERRPEGTTTTSGREASSQRTTEDSSTGRIIPKVSLQELKTPALIKQRLRLNVDIGNTARQQILSIVNNRSQFRSRSYLLPALAALAVSQGNENNQQTKEN